LLPAQRASAQPGGSEGEKCEIVPAGLWFRVGRIGSDGEIGYLYALLMIDWHVGRRRRTGGRVGASSGSIDGEC